MTPAIRMRAAAGGLLLGWAALALPAAAAGPAVVKSLIAVLQRPGASLHEKARACQQLGEFGTKEAVPALAALLADERLSAYARSGLEGIPDPSAAAALRAALPKLKGDRLIGVVNSLGALRDARAAGALSRLAGDVDPGAAQAALLALGRISNAETIGILRRTLAGGPEARRADAAAACLIAAEFQLAGGNAQAAVSLYDAVKAASVPLPQRLGAMRGAIVARQAGGVELLVELLRSEEREIRNVALLTVREVPSAQLAEALNSELGAARPELQAQLIEALADCHNARSPQAVRARLASESPLVRRAALKTLGKIGGAGEAGALLKALGDARSPEESEAAAESLKRIEGAEVDARVLKALSGATGKELRLALIEVLDARSPAGATGELLRLAADPDQKVGLAAFKALRSTVGLENVPALIALTKSCQDGMLRAAAEAALFYACTRSPDIGPAGELVLAELKRASGDLDKSSWIRTLASMGYDRALPAIAPSLRDSNAWLAGVTIESLKRWPGPAPVNDLLSLAERAAEAGVRSRALSGAVQLATTAGNGRQAPVAAVAAWFQRAGQAAQSTEDKSAVLSALGRWTHVASIRLLVPYLDDAGLKAEAASAILSAAGPVAEGPDCAMLKPVLDRIAATGSQVYADRISTLRRAIAAAESGKK